MDFLKINLDELHQPAIVRLRDDTINIVQAIFSDGGCALTCFGTDVETKRFLLSTDTMNVLHAAWTDYHMRICAHQEEQETRKEQAIAEAKKLASSVKFNMEGLNIEVRYEDDYWGWVVENHDNVIRFHNDHLNAEQLPGRVQAALHYLKSEVEKAEHGGYATNDYYRSRVASYRRAFPIEPEEIQQARALLKEAGIENWTLTPNGTDPGYYHFYVNEMAERENWPAAQLLEEIREYVSNHQEIAEQGVTCQSCGLKYSGTGHECPQPDEPAKITEARKLLKEIMPLVDWANVSIYPTPNQQACPGCWSFNDGENSLFVLAPTSLLSNIHIWLQSAYAPQYAAYLERNNKQAPEPAEQEV